MSNVVEKPKRPTLAEARQREVKPGDPVDRARGGEGVPVAEFGSSV